MGGVSLMTHDRPRGPSLLTLGVAACIACCAVPLAALLGGAGLAAAVATWVAGAAVVAIVIAAVTLVIVAAVRHRRPRHQPAVVQIEPFPAHRECEDA